MFENPLSYGEEPEAVDPLFPDIDPVQKAAEAQREKLKKEAEEKAAKEAKQKAEKQAKEAKKLADKAAKKIDEKKEEVKSDTKDAKQIVSETKEAVADIVTAINSSQEQPNSTAIGAAPVEMAFTNGSEYTADLKEGEEAIFDLHNAVEKVEDAVDLADEVTARAEAIANARAALVEAVDGGSEELDIEIVDHNDHQEISLPESAISLPDTLTEPIAQAEVVSSDTYGYSEYSSSDGQTSNATNYNRVRFDTSNSTPENNRNIASRFISGVGAGFLTARARALRRSLESAEAKLKSSSGELAREINLHANNIEAKTDTVQAKMPENFVDNRNITPEWISKLIGDVAKGKVMELKKWQVDVLKAQYPELLKKYQRLDHELSTAAKIVGPEKIRPNSPVPGELPRPVAQSGYQPSFNAVPFSLARESAKLPELKYSSSADGSVSLISSSYITIVTVGGIIFGSLLIILFGF